MTIGQGRPRHAPWLTSRASSRPIRVPSRSIVHGQAVARRRVEDACPARNLATRLDGKPATGRIPRERRRERPPEAVVDGRRWQDLARPDRRHPAAGATRRGRLGWRDPRASRRSTWPAGSIVARRMTVSLRRQQPGAAVARVERMQPRRRPVIRADEDDPAEGAGRERLTGELSSGHATAATADAGDQALAAQRTIAIEHGIQAIPGLRPHLGERVRGGPGRGRRDRGRRSGTGARHPRPIARAERRRCDEPDRGDGDETRADRTQPT